MPCEAMRPGQGFHGQWDLTVSKTPQGVVHMRFSILKAILCLAFSVSLAHAQQPQAATPPADTSASQSKDSQATVYVYRYKQFVGSALSPSVYCDETELA